MDVFVFFNFIFKKKLIKINICFIKRIYNNYIMGVGVRNYYFS